MSITTPSRRLLVAVAALGLVAAACGDDGDDSAAVTGPAPAASADATTAPAPTEASMTTAAPAAAGSDIVDTAVGAGDFTTLVAAVQAAGLEDTLRGEGPFTVFAAADVVGLDGQAITTVNGATFTVDVADDGSVALTDGAGNQVDVVATDVQADNGVIHVIDGVLLPG
jgi:uncharacterized surface protein with fasciclin (FAS1) repeats